MNRTRFLVIVAMSVATAAQSMAQTQPATIPTVVAQAMTFGPFAFELGKPQFFDAQTPPNWPAALTPSGARILGAGMIGDSAMFRIRATVFEFTTRSNPRAELEDLLIRAGYAHPGPETEHPPHGGFVETPSSAIEGRHCKGSVLAMFGAVDSVNAPHAFSVALIDGEAGRQGCSPIPSAAMGRFPVTIPTMSAPPGTIAFGGGSGWSGSSGQMSSTLRTTMPTDSILAHYSSQLVAGGWKREGRPANADGVGLQRFSFREGQDAWTGILIIMAAGDTRQVRLEVARSE